MLNERQPATTLSEGWHYFILLNLSSYPPNDQAESRLDGCPTLTIEPSAANTRNHKQNILR